VAPTWHVKVAESHVLLDAAQFTQAAPACPHVVLRELFGAATHVFPLQQP
jgi:hypothetical protein